MKKLLFAASLLLIGLIAGQLSAPLVDKWRQGVKASPSKATTAKSETASASAPSVIEFSSTDLLKVSANKLEQRLALTGTLKATNQTIVKSKASGEIRSLLVKEGSLVTKGQVIAQIDTAEYELRLREREAQVRQAQAAWDQARRTFDNNLALVEKNFISQTALENSRSQLEAARSSRDAATANLALAKRALSDTVVIAPIAGIVGERFAQAGEKVSPDNRIVSLVDLSVMELEAFVPASDVAKLRIGQTVELQVEGFADKKLATLNRISPATAAGSRSVPIYLTLQSKDRQLRAGLFAQASLPIASKDAVLAIPIASVRDQGGRTMVYLVSAGRLEERAVKLGLRDDNARASNGSVGMVEVLEGLEAGQTIVAANLGVLRAGSTVKASK